MGSYKLIKEFDGEIITESVLDEATNQKKWTDSGVTLQADIMNKNKRMYPKSVLSEAINKHVKSFMEDGRALGELNHPETGISSIDLKNVSHKFVSVTESGSDYITKAEILDTPNGKIVQNLLEGGVKLGISSRALGNLKTTNGQTIVENLHLISLGDIVGDPSAPNAFLSGVLESTEFIISESGIITQKEALIKIDKYSKIIKEASKEDMDNAIRNILSDFTNLLK